MKESVDNTNALLRHYCKRKQKRTCSCRMDRKSDLPLLSVGELERNLQGNGKGHGSLWPVSSSLFGKRRLITGVPFFMFVGLIHILGDGGCLYDYVSSSSVVLTLSSIILLI